MGYQFLLGGYQMEQREQLAKTLKPHWVWAIAFGSAIGWEHSFYQSIGWGWPARLE